MSDLQVILPDVAAFEQSLDKVHDIDEMSEIHEKFITRICDMLLLNDKVLLDQDLYIVMHIDLE
jgi:hypothetical protein